MSIYREKYHKYKEKYFQLLLEGGSDKIDSNDNLDIDEFPDNYRQFNLTEDTENIKNMLKQQKKFQGYDTRNVDYISDDLDQSILDVSITSKIRGKIYDAGDFAKSHFVSLDRSSSPDKILTIVDQDDFDKFTEKFGMMNKKSNNVNIKWENVARLYKGIHILSSAMNERDIDAPFKNHVVGSWVDQDYNFVDEVVIFAKDRNNVSSKSVTLPFNAKLVDSYALDEDDFVKIRDAVPNNKVLLIDDIKSFDIFTNKYGNIIKRKKTEYIDINWHKVKKDYEGLLIDKDSFIKPDRYEIAFMGGNRYQSWWEKNQIEQGVVYIFN